MMKYMKHPHLSAPENWMQSYPLYECQRKVDCCCCLLKGRPYEIFTGKAEGIFAIPAYVNKGWVIKVKNDGSKTRYDFQFEDKEGEKITLEGLSQSFDRQYWNYAKLISGVLRHGMPLPQAVDLVSNLNLDSESINNWKNGVARSLKRYIPDGTFAADKLCPNCGDPEGLCLPGRLPDLQKLRV